MAGLTVTDAGAPVFDHRDAGRSESEWVASGIVDAAAPLDLAGVRRVVIVAAHPDDETLGAGGLIARAWRLRLPTLIVVASDGEASHDVAAYPAGRLAVLRRREARAAVLHLHPEAAIAHLGLTDGKLADAGDLAALLLAAVGGLDSGTLLASPWRSDGHPDHEAVAIAAEQISIQTGARLLQYPIWAWHWAAPQERPLAEVTWTAIDLTDAEVRAKERALLEHRSQVDALGPDETGAALLRPEFLEHFRRPRELFVAARTATDPPPDGRASLPAEYFDALYAGDPDPWSLESRWYERRKRALLLASLPRERFSHAFEVGCATGPLTSELARRCDRVLAVDAAAAPLVTARTRLRDRVGVTVEQRRVPQQWPAGAQFDLIVLSEVAYYCSVADLDLLVRFAVDSLAPEGTLVACHWRHPAVDHPLSGDAVHAALLAQSGLRALATHLEEDFRLDVLVHPATASVARREGIV